MIRILITGGSGFIGSNLSLELISKNYLVRVLDNLSPQIHGKPETSFLYQNIKDKVEFIKGDVRNDSDWQKALTDVDIVVHLAAETGTGQSMYEIQKYTDTNILGTARLLDYIINKKNKIKKIIIASSRAVYGEGNYKCSKDGIVYPVERTKEDLLKGIFECRCPQCGNYNLALLPAMENSILNPGSVYGISKHTQEAMALKVCRSIGLPVVALRYQNVYGPGQSLKNTYTGVLSIFSQQILSGKRINIFEDGKESRDFVYISDVVKATLQAIENKNANFQLFNVGSGVPISIIEVVGLLIKLYNKDANINVSGDFRIGDVRHNYADLTHINNKLQYMPKVFIEEGLKSFTSWVKTQEIIDTNQNYSKSLDEMSSKNLFYTSS